MLGAIEKPLADEEKPVVNAGAALKQRLTRLTSDIVLRIESALSAKKQPVIGTPYDLLDLLRTEFRSENRGAFIFFKDFATQWDIAEYELKNNSFNSNKIRESLRKFLLNMLSRERQSIMRDGFLKVDGETNGPVFFDQYIEAAKRVLEILSYIHPEEREHINGWQTSI